MDYNTQQIRANVVHQTAQIIAVQGTVNKKVLIGAVDIVFRIRYVEPLMHLLLVLLVINCVHVFM